MEPMDVGELQAGVRVEVRGDDTKPWRKGTITVQRPNGELEVQVDGWDKGYVWPSIRRLDGGDLPTGVGDGAQPAEPSARSFEAYKRKCEVTYADGTKKAIWDGDSDDDDDSLLAPGVQKAYGGLGGRDLECWQGRRCTNKRCKYVHPQSRENDEANGPEQLSDKMVEQQGQQAIGSGHWRCACGFNNRPSNEVCGGDGAMGCKKARPAVMHSNGSSNEEEQNPAPAATSAFSMMVSKAASKAPSRNMKRPVANWAVEVKAKAWTGIGQSCSSIAGPEATTAEPERCVKAAVARAQQETQTESDEELRKEIKTLETKLEIAQLRAENAELRLKDIERKYSELETTEKELMSSSKRAAPAAASPAAKGGKCCSKGSKAAGDSGKGDKEENTCWGHKMGRCKAGAACKWVHA